MPENPAPVLKNLEMSCATLLTINIAYFDEKGKFVSRLTRMETKGL